ncbi:hypothetical protein BpHYR1_042038 [Brachionus plicatilis]|uniref:Uncharacterized protein n=1 Tax=Brachionus plicatilis TaxID=10195 RepID=A0A3M7PU98_BRAPC|nr:hypothetical protein BpHYR1_042038 [Brachionus plicatilis]
MFLQFSIFVFRRTDNLFLPNNTMNYCTFNYKIISVMSNMSYLSEHTFGLVLTQFNLRRYSLKIRVDRPIKFLFSSCGFLRNFCVAVMTSAFARQIQLKKISQQSLHKLGDA